MEPKTRPFDHLRTTLGEYISSTPPGEKLPTEPLLARHLGVSRATLREAMRHFESMGLLRRRQGIGTFVVGHPRVLEAGLEQLESIETLAERIHLQVSMGDYKITSLKADLKKASALGLTAGDPVMEIARVINADGRPVAYLVDTLPEGILSRNEINTEFKGSVLDLLIKRSKPVLAYSKTEINAEQASSEVARALQIQRGDVLLMFVAYLYSEAGSVVDYSYSYFIPGYFTFHVVRAISNTKVYKTQSEDAGGSTNHLN